MKATDIIQEVDVLKAISWIKSTWRGVFRSNSDQLFSQVCFRKERPHFQVLDQEEEEEEEFSSLVKELSSYVSPSDYIKFDMKIATSQPPVGVENIAW